MKNIDIGGSGAHVLDRTPHDLAIQLATETLQSFFRFVSKWF